MMNDSVKTLLTATVSFAAVLFVASCSSSRRSTYMREQNAKSFNIAALSDVRYDADTSSLYAKQAGLQVTDEDMEASAEHDTISTGEIVMQNVRDEKTGEEMIMDVLMPSLIVSRFAQRQERGGNVPIDFQMNVPPYMEGRDWVVCLRPKMYLVNSHVSEHVYEVLDSIDLDAIYLSGDRYKKKQLRGYEQYDKYIASIINDSTLFVRRGALELFLQRNLPEVYAFRNDTTYVSDEEFTGAFGIKEQEVIDHFTRVGVVRKNAKKVAAKDDVFKKLVNLPVENDNVLLDTVINASQAFLYDYNTKISTKGRPTLNKALVYLSGEVYDGSKLIYRIPRTDSLEFTISSAIDFLKDTVMYKVYYVPTHLAANSEYNIVFKRGKSDLEPSLGNNENQMHEIKSRIRELLHNDKYILDSIVVTSTASPEGSWNKNKQLSNKRSASVKQHFDPFVSKIRDSLMRAALDSIKAAGVGVDIVLDYDADGNLVQKGMSAQEVGKDIPKLRFMTRTMPENWEKLETLMDADTSFTAHEKYLFSERMVVKNPDERERRMKKDSYYKRMLDEIYPQLRVVRFDFMLHRKATVQARIVTDEVDDIYEAGLNALKNRDWEEGIRILRSYYPDDYNLGVAYLMMDRNESARAIFEPMDRTPVINYLLAIAYMRLGRETEALESFKNCYREEKSMYWRGNRDPEIKFLINKYCLPYNLDGEEDKDEK